MPLKSMRFRRFALSCFAVATLALQVAAVPLQITAFLLSSMPMHPKQNLAAANRYGAPLFLRKSHQRFSLPFLCFAIRIRAVPRHCFAALGPSSLFLRLAKQYPALPCHCTAVHLIAVATHFSALLCLCNSMQSFSVAILRLASPSQTLRCNASANQGRQCHAVSLRHSPHRQCK